MARKNASAKRKAAAKPAPKAIKISAASKQRSKGEVLGTIAEAVGISRKEVAGVFDTMGKMIAADLSRSGPGVFAVPGMMKVIAKRLPATKERKGINPFTKEPTVFKAKPARTVVKVRPLKGLKAMVK